MDKKGILNSDHVALRTFVALLTVISGIALAMIWPFLLSLVVGGIMALICDPVFRWFVKKGLRPELAGVTATVLLAVLVVTPLTLFFIQVVKQAAVFVDIYGQDFSLGVLTDRLQHWSLMESLISSLGTTFVEVQHQLNSILQSTAQWMSSTGLRLLTSLPVIFLQIALSLLTCYFLLVGGPRFLSWWATKIPLESGVRTLISQSFQETAISTIWATLAASTSQVVVIFFGFVTLGVPSAFLGAGATFLLAWIPMVGSTPVWGIAAVYLYLQDRIAAMVIMIIFGLVAGIADNVIRPLVLRGRGGMHPLVSLVAILGGIQLFGVFGVFLGPIVAAIFMTLMNTWPRVAARFGLEW